MMARRGDSIHRTYLVVMALALFVWGACPSPATANDKDMSYEEYRAALAQIDGYFQKLYEENIVRVRHSMILQKCGYKKEADEIDVAHAAAEKAVLDRLGQESLSSGKL